MIREWFLSISLLIAVLPSMIDASNPLSLGAIVQVTSGLDILTCPTVNSTPSGFLITCTDTSFYIQSNFSSDGASWSTTSLFSISSPSPVWVGANATAFMMSWAGPVEVLSLSDVTFPAPTDPHAACSLDNGSTWEYSTDFGYDSTGAAQPIVVAGSDIGFMTLWANLSSGGDRNGYWSFTPNNGGTWEGFALIANTGTVNSAPSVCATDTSFIATWQDTSNNGYSSIASIPGMPWDAPVQITATGTVASDVCVSGNATGFISVWVDTSGNANASFTSSASNWNALSNISSNVYANTNVSISGTDSGFIAAWIGSDSNAYASFCANGGTSWSTPVAITSDASVQVPTAAYNPFIGLSAIGTSCIFSWLDTGNNVQSCSCTITVSKI